MNANLEQPNIETLAAISRERQGEMQREAQAVRALGRQPGNSGTFPLLRKLAVTMCVLVPITLWTVRVAMAVGVGSGGGGFIHTMM
jgi:hypothetical protein